MAVLKYKKSDGTYATLTNISVKPIEPVQVTGTSVTDIMSQDAVTRELQNKLSINNFDSYSGAIDTALEGKADTATTLGGYGITDANINNQVITLGSNNITVSSATQVNTAIDGLNDTKVSYGLYDSNSKYIYFYKNATATTTPLISINATDFIKDGMVDNVEVKNVAGSGTCLVITFNTDSGKEDINIPISNIFDASNYYTKSETSGATELSTAFTAIDNKFGTGFTVSSVTEVIEENERVVSAALNDLEENKLDASAYTPTDLSNYYQKSETSGATELSTAFDGKSDTSHTHALSSITSMEGYAIATSASSISTTDTLMQSIGKLEKRIALLEAALIVQNNGDVYGAGGDYE